MSRERKKILEMLANASINSDEAERLLNRLAGEDRIPARATAHEGMGEATQTATAPLKYLRVIVESADGDNVNIRVPLALVRTGIKLTTVMPAHANEALSEHGVDLSQLSGLEGEELIEALRELRVDIDAGDGSMVRVFCE